MVWPCPPLRAFTPPPWLEMGLILKNTLAHSHTRTLASMDTGGDNSVAIYFSYFDARFFKNEKQIPLKTMCEQSPSSESPKKTNGASITSQIGTTVQSLAQAVDSECKVTHLSNQSDGSLLVRISSPRADSSSSIREVLHKYYPLASVSSVENCIEGTLCVQILFPSKQDEKALAIEMAGGSRPARFFSAAAVLSAGATLVVFAAMLFASADGVQD